MKKFIHLPERPGVGRLGRHVEHDPRSRSFSVASRAAPLCSKVWKRHVAPFDQGQLGSCTGNAMAGVLATGPHYRAGRKVDEALAVKIYSAATAIDEVPGEYPPQDTGSSGIAVAKVAVKMGFIQSYRHAFSMNDALSALSHIGPVIIGVSWYDGFDYPVGQHAELRVSGEARGGHEVELLGIDVDSKLVKGVNSWGSSWGDHGYFTMSFETFERLLAEQGDVVVPLP